MKKEKIRLLCVTGVFTAIIFVFTAYIHVPVPSHTGYTHVGDGFIYLAACMLPLPYAVFAGAVGALLADCLTGYAFWAPATLIIKTAAVLFFSRKSDLIISPRNLLALIPSFAVCVGGYYLYDSLMVRNFIAPLAGIPGYITQSVLSAILFVAVGIAFDKRGVKNSFLGEKGSRKK